MTGWVRSSFCSGNGECIEVRQSTAFADLVYLRRVQDGVTSRPPLTMMRAEWDAFVAGVKNGDFDHLTGDAHAG